MTYESSNTDSASISRSAILTAKSARDCCTIFLICRMISSEKELKSLRFSKSISSAVGKVSLTVNHWYAKTKNLLLRFRIVDSKESIICFSNWCWTWNAQKLSHRVEKYPNFIAYIIVREKNSPLIWNISTNRSASKKNMLKKSRFEMNKKAYSMSVLLILNFF